MADISRVTPSGFITETGIVQRVTPDGFLNETVQSGFSGTPNAGSSTLSGNVPGLFVQGPPVTVSRVAPDGFVIESGSVARISADGFIEETIGNYQASPGAGGLSLAGTVPLLTRSAAQINISRVTPSGFITETGNVQRVTPDGFINETASVSANFLGSTGGAQCILVTQTPSLVLSYFAGSPSASNATLLGHRPILSISGTTSLSPITAQLVATGLPLVLDSSSNFARTAVLVISGTKPTGSWPFQGSPQPAQIILGGGQSYIAKAKQQPITQIVFGAKF